MSAWQDIEDGVVAALQALRVNGQPLLATVRGQNPVDRKSMLSVATRELLPAAWIVPGERVSSDRNHRRAGAMTFRIVLIAGSDRDENEARTGGVDGQGIYSLSEAVGNALQDLLVSGYRMLLVDDGPIQAGDSLVVWEQRYEARQSAGQIAPTFDGVSLAGSASVVRVEPQPRRQAVSEFAFPGVAGVFERRLGSRGRLVYWRGQLRAADHTAMNAIIDAIEARISGGGPKTMVDEWSRIYPACVARSLSCKGARELDELTGEVLQDFELEFCQLV